MYKTPSHIVYHVRNRDGGEDFWTRIGAAWAYAYCKGFNIMRRSPGMRL